jgi:hypothetical protein
MMVSNMNVVERAQLGPRLDRFYDEYAGDSQYIVGIEYVETDGDLRLVVTVDASVESAAVTLPSQFEGFDVRVERGRPILTAVEYF